MKQIITKFCELLFAFAICTYGLAAQESVWAVEYFHIQETDLDARVNYPETDPNGKACAIIKVETPYTGFTFDTGSLSVVKTIQKVGEIWVYVPQGVKKITIGHQRGILREWQIPMSIQSATVYVLKLKEAREAGIVAGLAAPIVSSGFAIITSEPEGADVFINDEYAGSTPYSGKYSVGTRLNIVVKKAKYHDDMGILTISGPRNEFKSTLIPAFGTLVIDSNPQGAQVFIGDDEVARGVTPLRVEKVSSGLCEVTLKKDQHDIFKRQVAVYDSQETKVFGTLRPKYAVVTIQAPQKAKVKIDGVDKGIGQVVEKINEGLIDIEVSLASHRTVKKQVEVVAGHDQTLKINPEPIYGSLSVNTTPFDCDVYINGVLKGKSPNIFDQLLIGNYSIELKKEGYNSDKQYIKIEEGKEAEVTVSLTQNGVSAGASGVASVVKAPVKENKSKMSVKDASYNEKYKNKGIVSSIEFGYAVQFVGATEVCYRYSGYRTYRALNPVFATYTLSYKINRVFSIGAGAGVQVACRSLEIVNDSFVNQWEGFKEKRIDVPVYANIRMSFCRSAVRPFINLRGGCYVVSGSLLAEGGLGLEFRLSRSVGMNLQTVLSSTPYPVDARYRSVPSLSIKLGLDF